MVKVLPLLGVYPSFQSDLVVCVHLPFHLVPFPGLLQTFFGVRIYLPRSSNGLFHPKVWGLLGVACLLSHLLHLVDPSALCIPTIFSSCPHVSSYLLSMIGQL